MHIDGKTGVSHADRPAPEAEGQGIVAGVHLIEQLQRLELAAQVGGLGVWDYDIALDRMTCDRRWYAIMGAGPRQTHRYCRRLPERHSPRGPGAGH